MAFEPTALPVISVYPTCGPTRTTRKIDSATNRAAIVAGCGADEFLESLGRGLAVIGVTTTLQTNRWTTSSSPEIVSLFEVVISG